MAKKSEIKVYLPAKLVGELEGRRRMGTRSKFIENALNMYLRKQTEVTPFDFGDIHMLCTVRDRFAANPIVHDLLQLVINQINVVKKK